MVIKTDLGPQQKRFQTTNKIQAIPKKACPGERGRVGSRPVGLSTSSLGMVPSALGTGFQAGMAKVLWWGCCHHQGRGQELAAERVSEVARVLTDLH